MLQRCFGPANCNDEQICRENIRKLCMRTNGC
jgi:hypothetical protein